MLSYITHIRNNLVMSYDTGLYYINSGCLGGGRGGTEDLNEF